jgi:hypothetical protein
LEKPVEVGADVVVELDVVFDVDEVDLEVVVVNVEEVVVVAVPEIIRIEILGPTKIHTWNTLTVVRILICAYIS